MTDKEDSGEIRTEDQPPIFGSWKKLYLIVLFTLAVLIVLFTFFSVAFK